VRLVVWAGVFEAEAFGAGERVVELHGAELPFAADAVGDDEVDFWSVEGGFTTLGGAAGEIHLAGDALDGRLGAVPAFDAADILVAIGVAEAEARAVVGHA
jgi:hypothetical protein